MAKARKKAAKKSVAKKKAAKKDRQPKGGPLPARSLPRRNARWDYVAQAVSLPWRLDWTKRLAPDMFLAKRVSCPITLPNWRRPDVSSPALHTSATERVWLRRKSRLRTSSRIQIPKRFGIGVCKRPETLQATTLGPASTLWSGFRMTTVRRLQSSHRALLMTGLTIRQTRSRVVRGRSLALLHRRGIIYSSSNIAASHKS